MVMRKSGPAASAMAWTRSTMGSSRAHFIFRPRKPWVAASRAGQVLPVECEGIEAAQVLRPARDVLLTLAARRLAKALQALVGAQPDNELGHLVEAGRPPFRAVHRVRLHGHPYLPVLHVANDHRLPPLLCHHIDRARAQPYHDGASPCLRIVQMATTG